MIKNISVSNFKCFDRISVECSLLNLFTGINGMGKSTLLQTLLLMRQTYEKKAVLEERKLKLNGHYVSLGLMKDIMNWDSESDTLKIKIDEDGYSLDKSYNQNGERINGSSEDDINKIKFLTGRFEYISAERLGPRRFYDALQNGYDEGEIGIKGENTVLCLGKQGSDEKIYANMKHETEDSIRLDLQVNAWMREISPGISVNAIDYMGVNLVGLKYGINTPLGGQETNAVNMGFGVTYVLPVIVAILNARKGDILVIENPEAHLHPKGQRRIGELVALAAENGVQIFMETHSDHILNGIRLCIKNKRVSANNVKINYFYHYVDSNKKLRHDKTSPEILENGDLSNWPEGFFDEWDKAIDELFEI